MRRQWLALACSLLIACQKDVRAPGVTVLLDSSPDSLDDRVALSANGQRLAQLIAPGLVRLDAQSRVVPDLAESFEQISPVELEFVLRRGLTFHDGSPLTAADVKATFDSLTDPALASPKRDRYEALAGVEVVDPRRIRFHLTRAHAPILADLGLGIIPAARARGPAALQGAHPIGAGPYQWSGQPDEDHVELRSFAGFYGGEPRIASLSFRVVRDETTRVLELLKGRADLAINVISPALLPVLQDQPQLRVITRTGSGFAYLGFNVRGGPTADVRVRRAICAAIDVAPILAAKFHGLAHPATGMLPEGHWAYAATPGCRHDAVLARRLLDEAGWTDPDGDGPRPRLTLSFKTTPDRFRKAIALILKEQLAQVGVAVELRSLEFGTFFDDVRKGNFELYTLKWTAVEEPDLLRAVYSSTQISSAQNHYGGLNRAGYTNSLLDAELEAARVGDFAARRGHYAAALQILAQDLPTLPLWHEDDVAVLSTRLTGFELRSAGTFRPLADTSLRP